MITTIDAAGRLVIPRAVRRQAGLEAGATVEVRWQDGHIEIEPTYLPVRLEKRGHLVVAVPEREVPPLTAEMVEETLQQLRDERG